jgi:hypothetical protein
VGDHDHDRATALELSDGSLHRRLALSIEIGICFVDNDQKRVAVEGACKPDALALSG